MTNTHDDALSKDFMKAVGTALASMKELCAVLDRETDAIEKQDTPALIVIRHEKAKLIRDYRSHMLILIHNPDRLKTLPMEVRGELEKVGVILAKATQKNVSILKTAISATQSLVATIIGVARDQIKSHDSYSDPRKTNRISSAYGETCSPVAVSRTA